MRDDRHPKRSSLAGKMFDELAPMSVGFGGVLAEPHSRCPRHLFVAPPRKPNNTPKRGIGAAEQAKRRMRTSAKHTVPR